MLYRLGGMRPGLGPGSPAPVDLDAPGVGITGSGGAGATKTEVCPVGVTVSTACRPSTSVTFCVHPGACFA
jgi:hypothetical protein